MSGADGGGTLDRLRRLHQIWGWAGIALFAGLGLTLEAMNGLKLGFYLDADNALRRELWRLGHAHGTLLSLVQVGYASALAQGWLPEDRAALASFLQDNDEQMRLAALLFLVAWKPPSWRRHVHRMLKDPEDEVRRQAVGFLAVDTDLPDVDGQLISRAVFCPCHDEAVIGVNVIHGMLFGL